MKLDSRWLEQEGVVELCSRLMTRYRVIGPRERAGGFEFGEIGPDTGVRLDYDTTVLPPIRFLAPSVEVVAEFGPEGASVPDQDARPMVLLGIHPCDVRAVAGRDRLLLEGPYVDWGYAGRRTSTLIVALNCERIGQPCRCGKPGPVVDKGYDLRLTAVSGGYVVDVGSPGGKDLADWLELRPAGDKLVRDRDSEIARISAVPVRPLPELTRIAEDEVTTDPLWEELADDCLGCGACTVVCPTCFCYRTRDQLDLAPERVRRLRMADSCLAADQSRVAGDHRFRPGRVDRLRMRMLHKLAFQAAQTGKPGCVGCGRCVAACPAQIDPGHITRRLGRDNNAITSSARTG